MAVITVQKIEVLSNGKYSVEIIGIDPMDHDCIVGEIALPAGKKSARWNLSGIMRDGSTECNLAMNSDVLADLKATVQRLGAN